MRNLIFLFVLGLGLVSCGGDDCTPETIAGTYTGINNCDDEATAAGLPLNEGEVTFTVEHLGENNYSATDSKGETTLFTVDGCNLIVPDLSLEFFGITILTSGDGQFNGDQLNLNITTTVDGLSFTCNYSGTKQ